MRSSPGTRLMALAQNRLLPRLARLFDRPLTAKVQRLGAQSLKRVADRFPQVADLLSKARDAYTVQATRKATHSQAPGLSSKAPSRSSNPVESWLDALTHPDWQTRAEAARDLADVSLSAATFDRTMRREVEDALVEALRDPSAEVAASAAVALAYHNTEGGVRALLEVAKNQEGFFSPVVRAAAVHGLAGTGRASGLSAVHAAVQDVDAEVSLSAIAALTTHVPAQAATSLLPVLDESFGYYLPLVRLAAAEALVRAALLSPEEATTRLAREQDANVREVLLRATQPLVSA